MRIMNFNQYKINEDDGSKEIIHKIFMLHHQYTPTDWMRKSEIEAIMKKSSGVSNPIPDNNFLTDKCTDEAIIKMHNLLTYLICDELLKNPDELENINTWKDICWWVSPNGESVSVDLLNINAKPTYNKANIINTMRFNTEKLEYPYGYQNLKKFDL